MENYTLNQRISAYNAANYCFEEDFKTIVSIILLSKKQKRQSAHKMYKQRANEGIANVLIKRHLIDDESKFQAYFRLTPFLFSQVLETIEKDLQCHPTSWVRRPISSYDKFCITLRYLATGESFRSLAFQYRAHHTTISRIVDKCLEAIIKHYLKQAIPTPTKQLLEYVIDDFFSKWNFPNCFGAIDGKHVRIQCPQNAGSAFFNYKDYHSIVLLAIVDANLKFIAVDVGSYGREGDAGIFAKSLMGKLMDEDKYNIPPPAALPSTNVVVPNVLIGDEAFALTNKMLKPYPRNQSLIDRTKAIYNYRHCRARRTTENVFGVMSSYFRIFFTPIHAKPEKIDKIILASCILHNLMREGKISSPSEAAFNNTDNLTLPTENLISISNAVGRPSVSGTSIREKFKEYFNGDGAVYWQQSMIN